MACLWRGSASCDTPPVVLRARNGNARNCQVLGKRREPFLGRRAGESRRAVTSMPLTPLGASASLPSMPEQPRWDAVGQGPSLLSRGQSQTGRWEASSEAVQEPKSWPLGKAPISPWWCNRPHPGAYREQRSNQKVSRTGCSRRLQENVHSPSTASGSRSHPLARSPFLPVQSQPSVCVTPSPVALSPPSQPLPPWLETLATASGAVLGNLGCSHLMVPSATQVPWSWALRMGAATTPQRNARQAPWRGDQSQRKLLPATAVALKFRWP